MKALAVVAAVVICLGGVVALGDGRAGGASFAAAVLIFGGGMLVGIQFYFIGVLISAQGQILKASLDTAVSNSPFLTDEHRASIMALPTD